jgi:hypothetical protein
VFAERLAELEVELVLAALLDRHRQTEPHGLGIGRDARAELLVDQHAGGRSVHALVQRSARPSKITRLACAIRPVSSSVGSPATPKNFFWNDPR